MFIPGQDYNGIAFFQEWNKYRNKKENDTNTKEIYKPIVFAIIGMVWVGAVIALMNFPF